jgi:glycerophosphoryl diester phosphodiesterase
MEEVLDRYGADVRYYIEIKSPEDQPGMERALVDLLDQFDLTVAAAENQQVLIQSFSAESLQQLHSTRPELPLVQLVALGPSPVDVAALDTMAAYAIGVGPASVNVDAAVVDAAHTRCLAVHPYTVDDPEEMARLLDLGVDGMFTNTPDRLLEEREGRPAPAERCPPMATTP